MPLQRRYDLSNESCPRADDVGVRLVIDHWRVRPRQDAFQSGYRRRLRALNVDLDRGDARPAKPIGEIVEAHRRHDFARGFTRRDHPSPRAIGIEAERAFGSGRSGVDDGDVAKAVVGDARAQQRGVARRRLDRQDAASDRRERQRYRTEVRAGVDRRVAWPDEGADRAGTSKRRRRSGRLSPLRNASTRMSRRSLRSTSSILRRHVRQIQRDRYPGLGISANAPSIVASRDDRLRRVPLDFPTQPLQVRRQRLDLVVHGAAAW